jgi:hypothetical protein
MRITDFPELVLPLGTDVLVGVDVVNDITKKIKLENLPVSIPTTVALNAKQNVLVSGTTIKTLNSISLLGSGDIVLTANASGVAGAVQFSNGSAFSSDASNLFWDNTDKRLGVGTNITTVGNAALDQVTQRIYVNGSFSQIAHYIGSTANGISGDTSLALFGLGTAGGFHGGIRFFTSSNAVIPKLAMIVDRNQNVGIGLTNSSNLTASARLHLIGSGSTSATTSLLVQDSAGTELIKVADNGDLTTIDIIARSIYAKASTLELRANKSGSASSASLQGFVSGLGWLSMFTAESGKDFGQIPRGAVVNGTTIDASAIFQVNSTTKGFLPPRMTTTQRDAIVSPATGLRIYNTTTNTNDTYNGTVWQSNSVSGVSGAIQFSNGSAFASDAANLFWDDTNNRLGVGTNAPSAILHAAQTFGASSLTQLDRMGVFISYSGGAFGLALGGSSTNQAGCVQGTNSAGNAVNKLSLNPFGGNVAVGQVGAGSGLAMLEVRGSGSTGATNALLVQNSGAQTFLTITDNGLSIFNGTVQNTTGPMQALSFATSSAPFNFSTASIYNITGTASLVTSGRLDGFLGQFTFAPTSGTAVLNVLNVSPTINQTGGANGITRGLYINPTLTSAADFRAIEVTNGNVLIGNSASNTAKLSIKGSGSTPATTALLVQNSAGTDLFRLQDDGRITTKLDVFTLQSTSSVTKATFDTFFGRFVFGNGTIEASAVVAMNDTTRGFLPPRMTTTQINAIASPATGLEVFNTTLNCTCFYNGTGWRQVTHTAM